MKLKEVCNRTGLTQKTIRFYEEKQLFTPITRTLNGRVYREYTEENVQELMDIATLRKALFSLEEIYLIQQDPEEIEPILSDYAQRIKTMSKTIKALSETLDHLTPQAIQDVSQLAQAMTQAAKPLPLPAYDAKPKFKYIEEQELSTLQRQQKVREQRTGESPFFLEQQKFTVRKKLFGEILPYSSLLTGGSANFPKPKEPQALRIVNLFLSALLVICTLVILFYIQQRKISRVNTWNEIKVWLIPLDMILIALRLTTYHIYKHITK